MKETRTYPTLQDVWYTYRLLWLLNVRPANQPTITVVAFAKKCWHPWHLQFGLSVSFSAAQKPAQFSPFKPTCWICFGAGFHLCFYEQGSKDKKACKRGNRCLVELGKYPIFSNLIRTSFCRFLKRKKKLVRGSNPHFPSTAPCAQLVQKSRGGCRLHGKPSRRELSSDLSRSDA